MAIAIGIFIGFLVVSVVLGIFARTRVQSLRDMMIAGGLLSGLVVGIVAAAAELDCFNVCAFPGIMYTQGIGGCWWMYGGAVLPVFVWGLSAYRMKKLSEATDTITTPDILAARFYDKSNIVRGLACVVPVLAMWGWLLAEVTAGGLIISPFFHVPYEVAMIIVAAVVLVYLVLGGQLAAVWVILFQGTVLIIGLGIAGITGWLDIGGWTGAVKGLEQISPHLVEPMPIGWLYAATLPLFGPLSCMGFLPVVDRVVTMKRPEEAKVGFVGCMVGVFMGYMFILGATWAARITIPVTLDNPEISMFAYIGSRFPVPLASFIFTACVAVVMSTIAMLTLTVTNSIIRDILQRMCKVKQSDKRWMTWFRVITGLVLVISIIYAALWPSGVFDILTMCLSYMAVIGVPLLIGLWWKRVSREACIATMIFGIIIASITNFTPWITGHLPPLYPAGFSAICILVFMLIVTPLMPKPPQAVMDTVASLAIGKEVVPLPKELQA